MSDISRHVSASTNGSVRAAVLCIGTEITEGIIQDGHVHRLAGAFSDLGIELVSAHILPDDASQIEGHLCRLATEVEVLVLAGGLGPTSDDLTRECVAAAAGVPLDFHKRTWDRLLERGRVIGVRIAEANKRQAMVPRGFEVIPNNRGTAPGFKGMVGGCLVVALPGPPAELVPMLESRVVPDLAQRFRRASRAPQLVSAYGVSESDLEEGLQKDAEGLRWSTRLERHRIVVTLRGDGDAGRATDALTRRFGAERVVRGDVRPGELVLPLLTAQRLTVACAESCTGGGVSALLTDIAGSSAAVWGGFVTYANGAKVNVLGVPQSVLDAHGAVSEECVKSMTKGALRASTADLALAISGVAGPGGGTEEKPVGTVWVAWQRKDGPVQAEKFLFAGDRDAIRRRAAIAALVGLRRQLLRTAQPTPQSDNLAQTNKLEGPQI